MMERQKPRNSSWSIDLLCSQKFLTCIKIEIFLNEGLNPAFQLIGANFDCLIAFLAFGGLNGMPEIDGQTQEDNGHLKGE